VVDDCDDDDGIKNEISLALRVEDNCMNDKYISDNDNTLEGASNNPV
jgi:hypothetical protein